MSTFALTRSIRLPTLTGVLSVSGDVGYGASAPPVSTPGKYRMTQPWLFVDPQIGTELQQSAYAYTETPARSTVAAPKQGFSWGDYGPNYYHVEKMSQWAWTNLGGDWINAAGTAQATANPHFTFAANAVTSGASTYTANITAGVQAAQAGNRWNAYIVKCVGGQRSIASQHHPSLTVPSISVTYADATVDTLQCVACARLEGSSTYSRIGSVEHVIATSLALEFERPTKAVASATLTVTLSQHNATPATINGYLANPTTNTNAVVSGIAAAYPLDNGISANANVLFAQDWRDGTTLTDWVIPSTSTSGLNVYDVNDWDPAVLGIGSANTAKLPHAYSGLPIAATNKWFHKYPYPANISKVDSNYTGEGFAPLAAGLGAMRVLINRSSAPDDSAFSPVGAYGADLWALFDDANCGTLDRVYLRYYVRFGSAPAPLATTKMFRQNFGTAVYATRGGKFGPGLHHWTQFGGNNNVGGNNLGWTNRNSWFEIPADAPMGGIIPGVHSWDMLGYNMLWGKDGGLGGCLVPDQWYCVEVDCRLNTFNPAGGSPSDGVMTVYVDGRIAAVHTGWKYRDGPIDYVRTPYSKTSTATGALTNAAGYPLGATVITLQAAGSGSLVAGDVINFGGSAHPNHRIAVGLANVAAGGTITLAAPGLTEAIPAAATQVNVSSVGLPPFRSLGPMGLALCDYQGGILPADRDMVIFYTGIVASKAYVGQMASSVPALNLSGANWTPNRDVSGDVLLTDFPQLPLNTWLDVVGTNSELNDVIETPHHPKAGTPPGGPDGAPGIVAAWGGAAWDYNNQRMIIAGGGHGDSHECETGIYGVTAAKLQFERLINRQPLSQVQSWDFGGTNALTPQSRGNANTVPLLNGVPAFNHTYHQLLWVPPGTPGAGSVLGGVAIMGNVRSVVNLDTGVYQTAHWNNPTTDVQDWSNGIAFLDGNTVLRPSGSFFWWRYNLNETEATTWSATSFGRLIKNFASAAGEFRYNDTLFIWLRERREAVSLGRTTKMRVRYGQAMDAAATSWTSYYDAITLTGAGAADFTNTNLTENGYLAQAGAHYDHAAGCIWVQGNDVGSQLYQITGIATNTWTVTKIAGTGARYRPTNLTYGRFKVATIGGVKLAMRVSSTTDPLQVMRIS